eukprot:scaffold412482_cov35-Attheya_sp.AAC.1
MKGTMPYCGNTLTGSLRTRCHSWNHRSCIVKWVHNGFTVGITDRDWCNGFTVGIIDSGLTVGIIDSGMGFE